MRVEQLIFSDAIKNHNKFYRATFNDDGSCFSEYGRVGYDTQRTDYPSHSILETKLKQKLAKGYTPLRVIGGDTGGIVQVDNLQAVAQKELAKNSPELGKLIERLVKANIHNITSKTNITYNSSTGLFQTPLGVVTQDGIDEARNLLVDIKRALNYRGDAFKKLVSSYLRIIPQDIGMKFDVSAIFPDTDSVQKQSDILDSLEASYKSITSGTTSKKTDDSVVTAKIFEVDLSILPNNNEYDRLDSFYKKSKKRMHGYDHINIKQIFKVIVSDMDKGFDRSLGNVTEVYHGTSQANLLSILKSGLKVSPPSSAYIAGKMFGNGIYGAVNSSKSLGYTFGRWGGSRGESGWLFVCDFAMGKIHYPHGTCSRPGSGCDSVWAKADKCGLNHDELIIYRNNQVNIKYLLECK